MESLRGEVTKYLETEEGKALGKSAQVFMKDFELATQNLEVWSNYRYYYLAVFEPGLSIEQRRLLYDYALEKLEIPLPVAD